MAKHIFYIPASYAATIYAMITAAGLLLSLYVGLCKHSKRLLENECGPNHWEFWPSISSCIGDFIPERQIWRIAFVLCCPFRLGATITLFSVLWQKACGGMKDVYALLNSPRQFLGSTAFLVILMLWSDIARLIGALVWTMVTSSESFPYHNLGFAPYIVFGFALQIALTVIISRNKYNLTLYETQRDAHVSLKLKKLFCYGQSIGALGVVLGNAYHKSTCYPGTYSIATLFEWLFALCNVAYDATAWYELKKDGWWLSGSPEFYLSLFGTVTGAQPASGGINAPRSALAVKSLDASGSGFPSGSADETGSGGGGGAGGAAYPSAVPGSVSIHIGGEASNSHNGNGNPLLPPGAALSASAAANAPLPAPPSATGEFFLAHDVILHRFTFCSAPSRLSLWMCDIYWSSLMFEMMVHVVEHMYFMPLIAMSLSWEVGAVLVFGAPCLLRVASIRRWATGPAPFARTLLKPSHLPAGMNYRVVPMHVAFYCAASFSHLHLLIQQSERQKLLGVAVGPLFLLPAIVIRYMYPCTARLRTAHTENNEDSRRMLYAFPLGLVYGMLQRICHISVSPMFVEPFYAGVFGIVFGLAFTTVLYRQAMFGNAVKECAAVVATGGGGGGNTAVVADSGAVVGSVDSDAGEENSLRRVQFASGGAAGDTEEEASPNSVTALAAAYPAQSPYLLGMIMGLVTSLSLIFYTCANYIPRLLAVEPYPASLLVVAAFAFGLYYSPDVIPICPQLMAARHRLGAVSRLLTAAFRNSWRRFGVFLLASTVLMLYATRQSNFTYEEKQDSYPVTYDTPRSDTLIKYWSVQEHLWGSKRLAFLGGLGLTFAFGCMFPVAMEVCFAHLRARRFALLADAVDAEQVFRREPGMLRSFEAGWLTWTMVPAVVYALCISYPFVPGAEVFREKTRTVTLVHVMSIWLLLWHVVRKMRHTKSSLVGNTGTARKQRSMQRFVAFLVVFAFAAIVSGRLVLAPEDVSYPAGKDIAIKYQDEVLRLHELLIELRIARNGATDPLLKRHDKQYILDSFKVAMDEMGKNVTSKEITDVEARFGMGQLERSVRSGIWEAAKAMTFFSGMIWTVHFALDNFNVDSLDRMVLHAKKTEAGVIGLLESDSMHLVNGNRDMVEHMAYYTGFRYTDYGPTALDNTYGCGMISRYPIASVRRYIMPSPLGELACMIHAVLDVYGAHVHTYVAHFGNTHHFADGLLQSQFLGQIVQRNPGPSLWLGYLVTFPGAADKYHEYTDPTQRGKFRDTALETYARRPWTRLRDRGGFEEEPPLTVTASPGESVDFNVEAKLNTTYHLEKGMAPLDRSFRRTPPGKPLRHFYFNQTNRYATAHPRFEFVDRYCQYTLYKTGAREEELPDAKTQAQLTQPYEIDMFDWWRTVDDGVEDLSDTEIQVAQMRFRKRREL